MVAAHYAASKDSRLEELLAYLPKAHPDYIDARSGRHVKRHVESTRIQEDRSSCRRSERPVRQGSRGKQGQGHPPGEMDERHRLRQTSRRNHGEFVEIGCRREQKDDARLGAAQQLLDLQPGDAKLAEQLLDLITPRASPTFSVGILGSLAGRIGRTAPAQAHADLHAASASTALRISLSRPESTRQFLTQSKGR